VHEQGSRPARPSAPGWNADPYGRYELRYWDGRQWTGHVSDHGAVGVEWAAVPASADAAASSEAALHAMTDPRPRPGGPLGGPSFGARPAGLPSWATTRSGLAPLPGRPPPSPHFTGSPVPDYAARPAGHAATRAWLWCIAVAGALLVAAAIVVPSVST
jgi:hypothetical protein